MKKDVLILMNLPKSFDISDLTDYLPQDEKNPYDALTAENTSVVFKNNESSTGVTATYNTDCRMLTLHLSTWANECDVTLCAFLVNSLIRNSRHVVLRLNYMPRELLSAGDVENMITSRHQFLKRCIFTNDEFHMEGLFVPWDVETSDLDQSETTDRQAQDVLDRFTQMQWSL